MQTIEATQELIDELKQAIHGEVRFDRLSRLLYSTDASNYQMLPVGVVLPRDADDVSASLEIAHRRGISVVPRGGGTSLSGQTIGPGLILDHSRYMNRILEINPEERWVRVEAGLALDQLNAALRPHHLMVGPDPASSASATLGGMTGNNSTGTHSIKYGMILDHIREVEVVLSDGSRARFGPETPQTVASLARRDTLEGCLYREIPGLIERYQDEIHQRYPHIWRNVAGYNLNRMLANQETGQPFSLAPLIVGSEGTLASITALSLNIVLRPTLTRLMIVNFEELRAALEMVPLILESDPAAIELVDRFFIHLTRQVPEFGSRLTFVDGDPRCLLIVEFAGETEAALAAQAAMLEATLHRYHYQGKIIHQTGAAEIANVWTVRKAGFGLLMSMRGDAKALSFADDATVPVAALADYALAVEAACAEVGTEAAFFAHASAGCLHINPLVNLKSQEGLKQMRHISQSIARLAIAHGGTTTGEHGEGLARSYYNEQLYGPRLHQAFREVKALFDPHNNMNPGKIIDAPAPWQPELLRFNPDYKTPYAPNVTLLDFSADGGFAGLVEMCNGQGVCRKRDSGAMCPSYMATQEEAHSTRGRANALRAAMTGQLGPEGLASRELYEVLDLCLECKACKRECPSLVDMAKLKYEFLAYYQAQHGVPLRNRLFAHVAMLNKLGSLVPGLANWAYRNSLLRSLLDRLVGIDRRRILPPLASQTFQRWFQQRTPNPGRRGRVILWDDTYLSYNEPEIGQAAVRVLEAAGFEVQVVTGRRCCGRPMISKGLLTEAKQNAEHNTKLLAPFVAQGIPIVGLEPSCIATFRDEYPDLVRGEAARQVAAQSFFIEEFLTNLASQGQLDLSFVPPPQPRHILVHGHCYQKALTGTGPLLAMLRLLPNTRVEEIPSGCCGMAGSFGYEKEHYAVSLACGEDRLFPAVRAASPQTLIAAAGISCRHQIAEGTGRQARHPIVILEEGIL
jgi:FAD/FMN-containing dehydrogenase/Fe-S oxidoreductase